MKTVIVREVAVAVAVLCVPLAAAQTIAQINGAHFLSPYNGMSVTNVTGLVTAKISSAIWLRSTTPDNNPATSESIQVYDKNLPSTVAVGDIITISGTVNEYRSSSDYVYLTEIINPSNAQIVSTGNTVTPVVLGTVSQGLIGTKNASPPTVQYTSLDNGNVFAVPNNQSLISQVNPALQPSKYGMDFWESLSGELVTVHQPVALDIPNSYGDTWVVGNWKTTGKNARGGLTMSANDGNPEAILIQTPLDGTQNPLNTKLGDNLADITGVIVAAFGSYTIRPMTAVNVTSSATPALPPPTQLKQSGGCQGLTISDYNVDNLTPTDANANKLANQVITYLKSPTILFLQEVQDNDGPTDDGVVSASKTLQNLVNNIKMAGGPTYSYLEINPVDDTTGGQPGGNIRNAYLYNANVVKPAKGTAGNATQANKVLPGPKLMYNPGLIAPNNPAFNDSRRPLAMQWTTKNGRNPFFTVNVHATSKGGSTTLFGDERPPVNLGVGQRDAEAKVTAAFIKQILAKNKNAAIIAAGDWNEFRFVEPQEDFVSASGLEDMDDVVGTATNERYSYLFDQNSQALIHFYVSPRIAARNAQLDRIHVNTWVDYADRFSDHDPDVIKVNVCQ